MKNVVVFNPHLRKNIKEAKYYAGMGRKVLLLCSKSTKEIEELSQHPLVQVRFGDITNMLQMAGLLVDH